MAFELALQNFGVGKCFQLVSKLAFQKNFGLRKQNDFKMNFELGCVSFKSSFEKWPFIMQNFLHPFYQRNFLHSKGLCKQLSKKPFFKMFLEKASLQKPDALMHVEHLIKAISLR